MKRILSLLKSIRNFTEVKETEIPGRGYVRVWKTQLLGLVKKFDKLIFVAAHNTTEAVTAKKVKSIFHLNHIVLLDLRGGFLSA